MALSQIADIFTRASIALHTRYGVDVGLDGLVEQVQRADPGIRPSVARQALNERLRQFDSARTLLVRLIEASQQMELAWPFTAEGWEHRAQELARLITTDPMAGVADWLTDWFKAASAVRLDAAGRLQQINLSGTPGGPALADRAATSAAGIARREWHLAIPMLQSGVEALRLDGRVVPEEPVRVELSLLLARLAISAGRWENAEQALRQPIAEKRGAAEVLLARMARLRGVTEDVGAILSRARERDPKSLDLAIELVFRARGDSPESGLDPARTIVDAISTLWDVEGTLTRLLTDVPGELWIAIAERAAREDDPDRVLAALDLATQQIEWENKTLQAHIAEVRGRTLLQREPAVDALGAFVAAGDLRSYSGRPDLARLDYQQALVLDSTHAGALLGLADALTITAAADSGAELERIMRAVDLVDGVRRRGELTGANAWGFLVEVNAYSRLAELLSAPIQDALWKAMLAAARATAVQPATTRFWMTLASTSSDLGLGKVATVAAEYVGKLPDTDAQNSDVIISVLANMGHWEEVSKMVDSIDDTKILWKQAIRAYAALETGHPEQVQPLLATQSIESLLWVREVLITSFMSVGDAPAVEREARSLRANVEGRIEDVQSLRIATLAAVALGEGQAAESLAVKLAETYKGLGRFADASFFLAASRLLMRDPDGCQAELLRMAAALRNRRQVEEWSSFVRAQFGWLSKTFSLPLPDLTPVDVAVAEAGHRIEGTDAFAELSDAAAEKPDAPIAQLAIALATSLVHLALGRNEESLRVAMDAAARWPAEPELATLADWLRKQTLVAAGDQNDGVPQPGGAAPAEVPDHRIQVQLPRSWFTGYSNPVKDHAFFVRYLAEARARSATVVPPVEVTVQDELEPDRYRILYDNRLAGAGHVDPGSRYCHRTSLGLLPPALRTSVIWDSEEDLGRIPLSAMAESIATHSLAELITMPAIEVVARVVGKVAEVSSMALQGHSAGT